MIPALNAALFSTLAGTVTAAGSAVYFLNAPDNASLPYIVFDYTADTDENETPRRTKNSVLFVRAYADSRLAAGTIDTQVDGLLHLKTLTVTGYSPFWMARESAFALAETDAAGRTVYMAGAEYRIRMNVS